MNNMTDRDLLVKVVTVVNDLKEGFDEFTSGPGAARCQLHDADIKKIGKAISWAKTTSIGAFISLLLLLVSRVLGVG